MGHLEAVGVGCQLFAGHRVPSSVEGRGAGHHDDLPGIRLQSQRQLQRLHRIETAHDAGAVRRHTLLLDARLADAGKDQGYPWEQGLTALAQEIQCLRTNGDPQVDRHRRILVAQQRLHPGLVRRPRKPVGVEELGENFDAVGILGLQAPPKARTYGIAGRQKAVVREQHQDAFRVCCCTIRSEERQNRDRDQPWRRAAPQPPISAFRFARPPHGAFPIEARRR